MAVATIEIATELERVGEHAKRVARANSFTVEYHLHKPLMSVRRLANQVQAMLSQTLEGFAQRDVALVHCVLDDGQKADSLYRQAYGELLAVMNTRPRSVKQTIYLSRAAYNLKRAAERVCAIGEWVIFVVLGTMEGATVGSGGLADGAVAVQQTASAH
jgi:phosphate transport system protein